MTVRTHRSLCRSLITRQVKAFASYTCNHHQGSIFVRIIACLYRIRILALGRFRRCNALIITAVQVAGVCGTRRTGRPVVLIKFFKRLVNIKSCILQTVIQILVIAGIKAAGTGPAIRQIYAVFSKNADFCSFLQRQCFRLIFQEHKALLCRAQIHLLRILERFFL